MHLQQMPGQARRWWWVILISSLLLGGIGAYQQLSKPTQYAAKVTVYMSSGRAANVQVSQTSNLAVQQLASYSKLVGTDALAIETAKDAHVAISGSELSSAMKATLVKDTVLMNITTTLPDKAQAQQIAATVPGTLARVAQDLGGDMAKGEFKTTFTNVDGPSVSSTRSMPKLLLSTLVGLLLGAALGSALVSALGRLARGVRSPEELRDLVDAPVLGILPRAAAEGDTRADAHRWDGLRRLATNVANPQANRRVVAVAGANDSAHDVAAGLATALADSGRTVLFVSSRNGARGNAPVESSTQPGLFELPVVATPTSPREWRAWREATELGHYDHVVLDAPAVLVDPDASPHLAADSSILVAHHRSTHRSSVVAARQSLVAAGVEEIVGVLDSLDPRQLARDEAQAGVSFLQTPIRRPSRAAH